MSERDRLVDRSLFPQLGEKIYFDNAGAALYNSKHVDRVSEALKNTLLVNPHSSSDSEPFCFLKTKENATEAIQLTGRIFNFQPNDIFFYTLDNHTSIAGLRKMAKGNVFCFENRHKTHVIQSSSEEDGRLLVAYPAQSNFDGFRADSPVETISMHYPNATSTLVLLDIASLVSSSPVPFATHKFDFAPFSFYKLFGLPTSLGGLIIRKEHLKPPNDFFGGGSVKAWLPTEAITMEKDGVESWSLEVHLARRCSKR
ncbi:Oidioi.mRNA.OKI2018_I69.PAR.g9248.t1.cds [Oikopleura dioica]|uniref:Oidioi.mRNA.OKI2018_I69.PAR.g9248.t1.cds n=1 Tax=Oikopleura dioica TaxID=34765 RepID=A0ABN7RJR2_OIKDI|nr:Oidioi.mRNA.OKI2018_I69.PAR.g9248.t1.cds [Oikopleura dioica]